jgi:hypothetical protein
MVYKFRLLSDEVKEFVRDVEIKSTQTFFDFHKLIQDDLGFDSSQIASFFTTSREWEKEKEFTLFDMGDGENNHTIPMDKAILKNYIHEPQQRLLYVFDFFNERSLFIELTETEHEAKYSDYPAVTLSRGNPPQQILFGNMNPGSLSDADMDFSEDYEQPAGTDIPPDSGEDFGDDLPPGDAERNPDDESEE